MPMSERVTGPAVEASMEVTARLMRLQLEMEMAEEDGRIDATEWARIRAAQAAVRASQAASSRVIGRTDYQVERASGWLRANGPSSETNGRAKEHGLSIVAGAEMADFEAYDEIGPVAS